MWNSVLSSSISNQYIESIMSIINDHLQASQLQPQAPPSPRILQQSPDTAKATVVEESLLSLGIQVPS